MALNFQAGVGPSMNSCHLYKTEDDPRMSLCNSTVIARNYRGPISFTNSKLCKRCFKKLQDIIGPDIAISAELIGVSTIED